MDLEHIDDIEINPNHPSILAKKQIPSDMDPPLFEIFYSENHGQFFN